MKTGDGSIGAANVAYVERLYRRYLEDDRSVSESWRRMFSELPAVPNGVQVRPVLRRSIFAGAGDPARSAGRVLQERADRLIEAYLALGHRAAAVDPLGEVPPEPRALDPGFHGLSEADLGRTISYEGGREGVERSLRSVLEQVRESYCGTIGVELMHVRDSEARAWIRRRMEVPDEERRPDRDERVRWLARLTEATVFEEFVRKRFVGSKSYSLEGAETLMVFLDAAVDAAGEQELDEIVLGMAHRGRLNVLANLLDNDPRQLFLDLQDESPRDHGDLRYHLGASTDRRSSEGRTVHLSLCFNPSHLEVVGPIALGRVRAKQDRARDGGGGQGMAIVVHGDAAFAGEGVVQELFNLSRLSAYDTGGTVHVVLDNQIGFTTPPEEGRSSVYATDVALQFGVPVFHVNGDDPEAVVRVASIAMDFRARFRRDAMVDLRCYRRFGHSEVDEPRFTQPLMYALIEEKTPVREVYMERLIDAGDVTKEQAERMWDDGWKRLQDQMDGSEVGAGMDEDEEPKGVWASYHGGPVSGREEVATAVDPVRLAGILESLTLLPSGFHAHPKVEKLLQARRSMSREERPLDWAAAEALALASLGAEGVPVRITGQDTARGTFSQRHAALFDQETGASHEPLRHVSPDQASIEVHNSPLSELGALGFEYGYTLDRPSALVLWEAQFGDFVNAAQVVIDQFIAASEDKWRRLSAIVLLLPHGFEGQGPEHSSARIERFLQGGAEDNYQVVQPSTPAQYFHLLRRQALQRWKKPLIVFTPKSLLRHPGCVSELGELQGAFRAVLGDRDAKRDVDRILLCSGKLYYELEEERVERNRADVAIVRLEELYPFPETDLREALEGYPQDTPVLWTQEEPENMGAWTYLRSRFPSRIVDRFPLRGVCRAASASPAGGSASMFRKAQEELRQRAFEDPA